MDLIERDGFLDQLTAAQAAAASGVGRLVLVSGEAGIGKTALLERLTQRLAGPRARVLWGACDALYTPRPLGPLLDMAHRAGGALRGAVERGADREHLFAAFLDELRRDAPATTAIFEDVHWADEATLDLLKFIGRRVRQGSGLVIATFRDDEVGPSHPLRRVIGDLPREAVQRLPLPLLTREGVDALARGAGLPAAGLHAATGGNPFFVTEVLASGAESVPASVRDAVFARAARLPPSARPLLDVVAVVPGRAERWLVDAVLGADPGAVEACCAAGMLVSGAGHVAFRHELARRAWEDGVEEGRTRTLHARVLAVLLERGAEAVGSARLVHHASHAGDADATLRYAPAAAREAARLGAHREATAHLDAALAHAASLPAAERAALLEGLAYECYLTGQIRRAIETRLEALALWRSLGEREMEGHTLRWLSRLHWFQGDQAAATRHALDAVEVLEPLGPSPALAMAFSNRAHLHMLSWEVEEATRWGSRAIEMAERLGDTETLVHALNNVGTAEWEGAGRAEDGIARLERSLRLALEHGYHEHVARAYTNLGSSAITYRDYRRGMPWLDLGIAYSQERDLDSWSLYMLGWRARAHLEQGRWSDAAEDADAVLRRHAASTVLRLPALGSLGHLRSRRGDPGAAELLDEALALALPTGELQRIAPVVAARAEAAWLAGHPERVAGEVRPAFERSLERGHPWVRGELACWLHRVGELGHSPPGIAEPYALEVQGRWREAAARWEAIGCPFERALVLARSGATDAMREALALFQRLGARPAGEWLVRELRGRGVRNLPRGPRAATRDNPAGLTPRQMRILELLADGLSNAGIAHRLFISPKTVDHHVSAVLARLGVRSRAEAAAHARSLGILRE